MPRQLPTVSIITPSFNHARYIESTMRSVLDQGYPNLQYIVMDGGSTDGTVEVLNKLGGRQISCSDTASDGFDGAQTVQNPPLAVSQNVGNPTFLYVSEKDNGQADAIRKGFSLATGQVIAWLNSDDVYKPGCIAAAATYLADHPEIALVYGDAEFIRADGSPICPCANPEPFSRHRLRHYSDYIVQPSAFFRRNAYEAVGGIDPGLHWSMDYDLWLKMADKYEFAYVRQCWSQYRWLGNNKSAAGAWKRIDEVRQLARRHGIRRLPAYFRMEAINLHLMAAREQWQRGKPLAATGSFIAATANALCSPRSLKSLVDPQTRRIIETGRILRASTVSAPV